MGGDFRKCPVCNRPRQFGLYITDGEGRRIEISTEGYDTREEAMKAVLAAAREAAR